MLAGYKALSFEYLFAFVFYHDLFFGFAVCHWLTEVLLVLILGMLYLRALDSFPILRHRKLLDYQKRKRKEGHWEGWGRVEGGGEVGTIRRLHLKPFSLCSFFDFSSILFLCSFPLPSFLFLCLFPPSFLAAYYTNTILEHVVRFPPWGLTRNFKSFIIILL